METDGKSRNDFKYWSGLIFVNLNFFKGRCCVFSDENLLCQELCIILMEKKKEESKDKTMNTGF